jgi:hypothetical protein
LEHLSWSNVADLIQHWHKQQLLRLGFVENVWWLPVTGRESQEDRTEFFWRIAFKEISGEFSKLVNSHLSKPLTFLFVRFGFSPNAYQHPGARLIPRLVRFSAHTAVLGHAGICRRVAVFCRGVGPV